MAQKPVEGASGMFADFSTEYTNDSNCNNEKNSVATFDQLFTVLDANQVTGSDEYHVIFTEYSDDNNSAVVTYDKELNSEVYTIRIQETEEINGSETALVEEETQVTLENTSQLQISPSKELSWVTVGQQSDSVKSKEICDTGIEEVKKSDEETSKDFEVQDTRTVIIKNKIGCDDKEKARLLDARRFYIEATEQNIFSLHGLNTTFPVNCDICDIDFDDMSKFDDHMRQHIDFKFFMCQLCPKTYKSWQNLVAHRKVCHNGQFISCSQCEKKKGHHKLGPISFPVKQFPVGCEECHIGFTHVNELNRHYRCHAKNVLTQESEERNKKSLEESNECKEQVKVNIADQFKVELACENENSSITFKREVCQEETLSLKPLNKHKKLHSYISVKYKCPVCSKVFKNMSLYKSHKLKHTGKMLYKCKVCFKTFKTKESLRSHQYSHPSIDTYRCFNCQIDFTGFSDMESHVKYIHSQNSDIKLVCDICITKHPASIFLNHYLNCYNNFKSIKIESEKFKGTCQVCNEEFSSTKALHEHLRIHDSSEQSFLCDICGIVIHCVKAFISHVQSHVKGNEKTTLSLEGTSETNTLNNKPKTSDSNSFMCEMCDLSFKDSNNLLHHIQCHLGKKSYQCNLCFRGFFSKKQLSLHVEQHVKQLSYKCSVCKKSFMNEEALHIHEKLHSHPKQLICPICSKKFHKRSACRSHLQMHSGTHMYKCDQCSKMFLFKYSLTVHKKTHINERSKHLSHQCPDCGQSFGTAVELQNHHDEKCYLKMITFIPSIDNGKKLSSSYPTEIPNETASVSE